MNRTILCQLALVGAMAIQSACSTPKVVKDADIFAFGRSSAKERANAWATGQNGAILAPDSIQAGSGDLVITVRFDESKFNLPFGTFDELGNVVGTKPSGSSLAKITIPSAQINTLVERGDVRGIVYMEHKTDPAKSVKQFVRVAIKRAAAQAGSASSAEMLAQQSDSLVRLDYTREVDSTQTSPEINLLLTNSGSTPLSPQIVLIPQLSAGPVVAASLANTTPQQHKFALAASDVASIKKANGLTIRVSYPDPVTGASKVIDSVVKIKEPSRPQVQLNILPAGAVEKEFGRNFAEMFYACDLVVVNEDTSRGLLVYGSSLVQEVRYSLTKDDVEKELGSLSAADLAAGNAYSYTTFSERRRPMAFSDILAIFNYDRQATWRQQGINWMKSAGTLATAMEVVLTGSGYAQGVSLFTGVLTPELEKRLLWDVLLHIDNLQTRSLKEVEEVPPAGQLHRVVFFPKFALRGIMPGVDVFIAEIKENSAELTVAKIEKVAVVQTANK